MNTLDITLYLVGEDEDDAQATFPFDSIESAAAFAADNPGSRMWLVSATIDFNTMEELT